MKKNIISREATMSVLRDYWKQYKQSPWQALIGFILPTIGTLLVLFIPPLFIGKMVDIFVTEGSISLAPVKTPLILFAVFWFTGEVLYRVGEHFMIRVKAESIVRLNNEALNRIVHRDYSFYANTFVGSLTKRAHSFAYGFETVTDVLRNNVLGNVVPVIFAMIVLWRYSPWLSLIIVAFFVVAISIVVPLARRRARLVDLRHEASSKMMGRLSDAVTNMLAVKSFAQEEAELSVYHEAAKDLGGRYVDAADYNNIKLNGILSPLYVGTNVLGLILAIIFAKELHFPAGTVVIVFSYFSLITRILWEINYVYRGFESSLSEAAEFAQMFIDPPSVTDRVDAKPLMVKDAAISFEKISFGYSGKARSKTFLDGFTLNIARNQKVGLVGPSGSGKTTITKLVLRFLDVQSGAIKIDGQDIKEVTQASLREAIAYVPQEPLLFHRTLLENISYGNTTATERDIIKAAKLAHAHEFISQLPHKYQTMVGERGIKLSGGQRQRVAIARALLKKSPILVLDEATSSLDSESEKYIQDGLVELMKDKTAIVIAHRLSTIKNLDRILVLDKGKIVQDGTHDELVAQDGLYAKLWSHQSGEFLDEDIA